MIARRICLLVLAFCICGMDSQLFSQDVKITLPTEDPAGSQDSSSVTGSTNTDESGSSNVDLRQSVVQITASMRLPNPVQPWNKRTGTAGGTGSLIAGGRVLTNAHVIAYASEIYVQGFQSADRVSAKLLYANPDIDLAILQIEDEEFLQGRPALEIATEMPVNSQAVTVFGFPIGGNDLSTTEGVISRIEVANMFNGAAVLRIQVDAAINPGNSGGPAISDGKLIGVVFSKATKAESTGYLIPAEEVLAFLEDVEDGTYDGRPQWMHGYQTLENEAIRAAYGLDKSTGGVLLMKIHGNQPEQPLKVGDIVTHIDGQAIGNDGKIAVTDSLRVPFFHRVPKSVHAGPVLLSIIRNGQPQEVQVTLDTALSRVLGFQFNSYPSYFIYGPLVFSKASVSLVESLPAQLLGPLLSRSSPLLTRKADPPKFDGEELVIVSSNPFSSPLMKGYASPTLAVVALINGVPVENLMHAAQLLQSSEDEFIRFDFVDHGINSVVFRREEAEAATESILQDNGIRSQFSDDLREIFDTSR
ncbi:MAG: trypsin-like peptidase domain-containing protein [Pirellulaceae bacterium]